jgi:hypothetical protein
MSDSPTPTFSIAGRKQEYLADFCPSGAAGFLTQAIGNRTTEVVWVEAAMLNLLRLPANGTRYCTVCHAVPGSGIVVLAGGMHAAG